MIEFRKLTDTKEDYRLLYKWCSNKNVYEWFEQRILTYEEIENKYKNKLLNSNQELYIIRYNNQDIGLIQIYKYNDTIIELNNYKNIYEYDLFIGEEEYLNKGIGVDIVNYASNLIFKKYNADLIILRPFKRNIRAIKCYLKCNYKKIYEYLDEDTRGFSEEIVILINEGR